MPLLVHHVCGCVANMWLSTTRLRHAAAATLAAEHPGVRVAGFACDVTSVEGLAAVREEIKVGGSTSVQAGVRRS